MDREQEFQEKPTDEQKRESGMPGGGAGRRDEVGRSGVFPASHAEGASPDAEFRAEPGWGQGERGTEGYEDSGESALNFTEEMASGAMEPAEDIEDLEQL
ncbi:MAG TPA: hypothetical protein VH590_05090 [Ktedonobacterales bacterium]|jgi:hypothetical protein